MKGILHLTVVLFSINSFAQVTTVDSLESAYLNWYDKCPESDKICGVAVERAYSTILKDKEPKKVIIVAVIDGGVDVEHEDLKGHIWINEDEIVGNGIDDDNNGYIDDIHGWNFLGNSKGDNIDDENLAVTRIYRDYKDKYEGKKLSDIPENEKSVFEMYNKAKKEYNEMLVTYGDKIKRYKTMRSDIITADKEMKTFLKKEDYTKDDINAITSEDSTILKHKKLLLRGVTTERLDYIIDYYSIYFDSYLNLELNARTRIIGDDPNDIKDTNYGNPNVKGDFAEHGSMVSGIIAALRNNDLGVNGISESVRIMALRTIPNGDEYDKDVALSIRYAVDNGANILNMSFGKYYSPMENEVYEAIKYAESKGVLMVAASGNDGDNVDENTHFPSPYSEKGNVVSTWLTVGANSKEFTKDLPADFSNYGAEQVHIFAPGVKVISTSPDGMYDMMNGTSFACPVVTGVATLVWSYYPELTAAELREVLLESSSKYKKMKVNKPGDYENEEDIPVVKFGTLSESGGIVNAYYALKLAEKTVASKK